MLLSQLINKTIADNYTLITNQTDVKIKKLYDLVNLFNNSINTIIETKYNELNDKIKDLQIGRINVYDPTTGKFTYIDVVINNVYDMLRFNAITAGEFDALALTAQTFDNKNDRRKAKDNLINVLLVILGLAMLGMLIFTW